MKKKSGKAYIISGAILLLAGILANIRTIFLLVNILTAPEPEGIGIIGGADAPTAIFLTDRLFGELNIIEKAGLLLIIIAPVLIIIGIVKCLCTKRRSKDSE
ncbi:hypothetical protein [Ruminococcus flavefaciens]|jgi:Na+-transporting methylmalonyl-CoA/oxaloacetate decarboxylase beta subunit|uniref:hypothetical protein n=1 Tax=Ruminococcus flavefaciens TaxID=1265 RepID=UPI0025DE347B|nr:hypothetical protein [Ruminococcus flavefaciens]